MLKVLGFFAQLFGAMALILGLWYATLLVGAGSGQWWIGR